MGSNPTATANLGRHLCRSVVWAGAAALLNKGRLVTGWSQRRIAVPHGEVVPELGHVDGDEFPAGADVVLIAER